MWRRLELIPCARRRRNIYWNFYLSPGRGSELSRLTSQKLEERPGPPAPTNIGKCRRLHLDDPVSKCENPGVTSFTPGLNNGWHLTDIKRDTKSSWRHLVFNL